MSLAHGREYLAIPGPSVMPDRVLAAMHRAAPNIYEGALHEMVEGMIPDLRAVARTEGDVAIYIANGHGTWEAALANTCARGDTVLVLATGRFALGWGDAAAAMGVTVETLDFGKHAPVDPARVEATLSADTAHRIRAILVVQVDTATSVLNDIPAIRAAIDRAGHPALLMVDAIAGIGCDRFEMDAWGVDLMLTASQKGLMTPPGLGFVCFNARAAAARDRADLVTRYWDWRPRTDPDRFYEYFGGTAPTHHLFALREALTMLVHEEGMEAAWRRHDHLARAVWAAFETWGEDGPLALNIADRAARSRAVTAVSVTPPQATALREWVSDKTGVTLGIGLGMAPPGDPAWHGFFRVAHMGHVNAHMVLGVLGVIESGLRALAIPHAPGGVEAAAAVIAEA